MVDAIIKVTDNNLCLVSSGMCYLNYCIHLSIENLHQSKCFTEVKICNNNIFLSHGVQFSHNNLL